MRLILAMLVFTVVFGGYSEATGEYAGMEVSANADPLLFGGRDLTEQSRVCLWVTSGSEFGFTVGPKWGPVSLGLGASFSPAEVGVSLSYLNLDFRFTLNFKSLSWDSVSLYQRGREGNDDSMYFRNVLSLKKLPLGLVGENLVSLGEDAEAQLFLGPFVELGKIKVFSANKLCLGVNILEPREYWVAWLVDF